MYAGKADDAGLPYGGARTASWILCWIAAGLFFLSFVSSATDCCCCVGRRRAAREADVGP